MNCFEEWNESRSTQPEVRGSTAHCVVLGNRFRYQGECAVVPYFYWALASCNDLAATVCKKRTRDTGAPILLGHFLTKTRWSSGCGLTAHLQLRSSVLEDAITEE